MKSVFKIKNLLSIALLVSFNSVATEDSEDNKNFAPEATAAQSILSFRDIPYLDAPFIDTAPVDRNDGIQVGELGIDGGNKEMVVKLAHEIASNKHGDLDSMLIYYQDKLLFESYYKRGRINLPHPQASATKAYTGLALGRAIQMGYLTMDDLDKPLISFLKELDPTNFVSGVEKITLHQALTMRSGIYLSSEQRKALEKNPAQIKGQKHLQTVLEHSAPITSASQRFQYKDDPRLVMQIIEAVVPGSAEVFIKNELLKKLGILNYGWLTDLNGLPRSGSGSRMTSRNMVKWGALVMNEGKWNGEQLVPKVFTAKATSRIVTTDDDIKIYGGGKDVSKQGYGYYWWSADLKTNDKSYFGASAQGGGGQYIILIEELDLMVVVTAHDNDNSTLQILAERILPAFTPSSTKAVSGKSIHNSKFSTLESH